jgi:hypothetical protein
LIEPASGDTDFVRLAWPSERVRVKWEPRLHCVAYTCAELEWLSVVAGLRRCCLKSASPQVVVEHGERWAAAGLNCLIVGVQAAAKYSTRIRPARPGEPASLRMALGSESDLTRFGRAWREGDHETMGELLGYPPCCRDFFRRVWVEQRLIDTTWSMAAATTGASALQSEIAVGGPFPVNLLWRWLGVRAVPHLPCRFDCQASAGFGRTFIELGRTSGFAAEMDWLEEVLSWPVTWSAAGGVATITTPILTITTNTDAAAGKRVVRYGPTPAIAPDCAPAAGLGRLNRLGAEPSARDGG